jgi:succinyl-diaminopimelate desuccinylase
VKPLSAAEILVALIRAPSVTPDAGSALDVLQHYLEPAGFSINRPVFEALGTPAVENLFAAAGRGARHLTLAGHVDVVPPGAESLLDAPALRCRDRRRRGLRARRGGHERRLAAMAAAVLRFLSRRGAAFDGRISFLVTGDEEGPAVNGTVKLLQWAAARGERFSAAVVGEPTSAEKLGDQIKIGRRGSYSATVTVVGVQGHAAYPNLADNPIRGLTQLLAALQSPAA